MEIYLLELAISHGGNTNVTWMVSHVGSNHVTLVYPYLSPKLTSGWVERVYLDLANICFVRSPSSGMELYGTKCIVKCPGSVHDLCCTFILWKEALCYV